MADISASDLQTYLNVGTGAPSSYVSDCAAQAVALVATLVGSTTDIPDVLLRRAQLEVGAELFNRRDAKNGMSQFADIQGNALRVRNDPLTPARFILAPYLPGGFA